jgi:carbonic anhydrase
VRAALENVRVGLADNWIRHIKDVHDKHGTYMGKLIQRTDRMDRVCELNVIEQVVNVCQTTSVQDAWARGQPVTVHGWVYGLNNGLVQDLGISIASADELEHRYRSVVEKRFS